MERIETLRKRRAIKTTTQSVSIDIDQLKLLEENNVTLTDFLRAAIHKAVIFGELKTKQTK